jgi:hypothetical protein
MFGADGGHIFFDGVRHPKTSLVLVLNHIGNSPYI